MLGLYCNFEVRLHSIKKKKKKKKLINNMKFYKIKAKHKVKHNMYILEGLHAHKMAQVRNGIYTMLH